MKLQSIHRVGNYLRLSRDDGNCNAESMSIANQKQLLADYVKERGWDLVEVYIDDGYSGTTFNRPGFQRMLKDIERGHIDCVITKDAPVIIGLKTLRLKKCWKRSAFEPFHIKIANET